MLSKTGAVCERFGFGFAFAGHVFGPELIFSDGFHAPFAPVFKMSRQMRPPAEGAKVQR